MRRSDDIGTLTGGTLKGFALAGLSWLVLAVTATAMIFTAMGGSSWAEWLSMFRPVVLYWVLWALVAPGIYRVVVHVPFSSSRFPIALLAHALVLGLFTVVVPVILFQAQPFAWLATPQAARFHRMNVPIYFFVTLACLLLKHYRLEMVKERRSAEMALEASQLSNQLQSARMDALKARLNPHFLFNALNGIAALVETKRNPEAYRAIELLGDLLRDALEQSQQSAVPLEDELRLVRRYMEIEKGRFGDRLDYVEEIASGCEDCEVPVLLLLPIVENAITHGVAAAASAVRVSVQASRMNGRLKLTVSDSGPGLAENSAGADTLGLGLRTTEQRLALQYGDAYGLTVEDLAPGARVTIDIPAGHAP